MHYTMINALVNNFMKKFKAYFISDLHLSKNTPNVALLFHYFLENIMRPKDSLYILGDFFEYYLGEDLIDHIQEGALLKLKAFQDKGSKIYFIHGNRDFLIKQKTLAAYGIQVLKDPSLIDMAGKKILLSHGDHLCTNDVRYQRYRKLARNAFIKWLFLHLPKKLRTSIAEKIHAQNPHGNFVKDPNYTLADASPEAINKELKRCHLDLFIYGHVHKMGTYQHGATARMVLGDWHDTGNYIKISENEASAKVFSLKGAQDSL